MNSLHFLNDIQIPVLNAAELSQDFVWDFPSPNATRSLTDSIEIAATNDNQDAYNVVTNWIRTNGVYNGIPYRCIDRATGETLFDGFAALGSENTLHNPSLKQWKIEIIESNQIFSELCAGINLRRFAAGVSQNVAPWDATKKYKKGNQVQYQGKIYKAKSPNVAAGAVPGNSDKWELVSDLPFSNAFNYSDYDEKEYLINQPFAFGDLMTAIFMLAYLIDQFVQLGEITLGDGTNPLTLSNAGIKIGLRSFFIATTILSLAKFIQTNFLPAPHRSYVINILKLFTRAFQYLGYTFETDIYTGERAFETWEEKSSISGVKKGKPKNNPLPEKTLLDFMADMGAKFNGKFKVDSDNKRVLFFRVDYFQKDPIDFQIPQLQDNGTETYNLSELPVSLKIAYEKDPIDKNLYSESDNSFEMNNSCTVHFNLANVISPERLGFKGTKEINLPFARVRRKTQQSVIEKVIAEIFEALSKLPGMPKSLIAQDRIGMMLLDTHSIGVSRCAIIKNKRIAKSDAELNDPVYLYNNFHKVSTIWENQWITRKVEDRFPIVPTPFVRQLRQWNVCRAEGDSRICVVTENSRDIETQLHKVTYRIKTQYINPGLISETIVRGE